MIAVILIIILTTVILALGVESKMLLAKTKARAAFFKADLA